LKIQLQAVSHSLSAFRISGEDARSNRASIDVNSPNIARPCPRRATEFTGPAARIAAQY
jgi:hypothetical protein